MSKPRVFRTVPRPLRALAPYAPAVAAVDTVLDGDTVRVQADPGYDAYPCFDVRIKDLCAQELTDRDPIRRALAEIEHEDTQALLPLDLLCIVTTYHTITDQTKQSFARLLGSFTLMDGRDLATVWAQGTDARWQRLQERFGWGDAERDAARHRIAAEDMARRSRLAPRKDRQ